MIEAGLGGRLDATNVVDPVATAITSIDFDHEALLGTTLAAIAAEKAGHHQAGVPVVVGPLPPEAERSCSSVAAAAERAGGRERRQLDAASRRRCAARHQQRQHRE